MATPRYRTREDLAYLKLPTRSGETAERSSDATVTVKISHKTRRALLSEHVMMNADFVYSGRLRHLLLPFRKVMVAEERKVHDDKVRGTGKRTLGSLA